MKKKIQAVLFIGITIFYSVMIIKFSGDVGKYITASINNCLTVIIPSLYIFMIISGFLVSTGLYEVISRPFDIISRYIFRIPTKYFAVFLISQVGGYPVGAKLLGDLKANNKIDNETAKVMMSYCYLGGPAFFCGAVGITLFNNTFAGIIVFISIIIANTILAVIIGLSRKIPQKSQDSIKCNITVKNLISSISSGAKSLFMICAIIVFFSSLICILDKIGITHSLTQFITNATKCNSSDACAIVKTFIEISHISEFSSFCYNYLPVITGLMCFGGLCIIMQIICTVNGRFPLKYFFAGRIFTVIMSYYISKLMMRIFDDKLFLSVSTCFKVGHRHISPIPTFFLLIMTILLLSKNRVEKI